MKYEQKCFFIITDELIYSHTKLLQALHRQMKPDEKRKT